jgi:Domain of unknown function (DUF4105)
MAAPSAIQPRWRVVSFDVIRVIPLDVNGARPLRGCAAVVQALHTMRTVVPIFGRILLGLAVALVSAWCVLAILRAPIGSPRMHEVLAALFGLVSLGALVGLFLPGWHARALGAFVVALVLFAIGWNRIQPSNDRPFRAEEGVLSYADIEGDKVTVHNIRNFQYRTETDFTPAYYDKTYDLKELDSVDLIAVYWMGPDIAHIMVSFGFAGRDYLAISIEARKEKGEGYSTIDGFFRHYELFYVVADERDVIGVRALYRQDPPEDVYLYRVNGPKENARRLFLEYLRQVNSLRTKPEFYNTLTTNCTTNIWMHTRVNAGHLPLSWKILVSGHVPEYAYQAGRLDTSLPFEELHQRAHINERAREAGATAPDFSQRIRVGLPGVTPPSGGATGPGSAPQLTE